MTAPDVFARTATAAVADVLNDVVPSADVLSDDKLTWYVARSGGLVAWGLLAIGLGLGLLLSSRALAGRRPGPAWLLAVHRGIGGLSVVFTVVHVVAIMLDDFVDFGIVDVLVPWASEWNPGAVAWGIVAMYLLVAVEVTSLAMRRLPRRLWRLIHWTSPACFATATVHGWQAGTDTGRAMFVAVAGSIVVLSVLLMFRVWCARRASQRRRPQHQVITFAVRSAEAAASWSQPDGADTGGAPSPTRDHGVGLDRVGAEDLPVGPLGGSSR